MKKPCILGTRGSALALTQSRTVASDLQSAHPDLEVQLKIIKTQGDLNQKDPLSLFGGKGVFVKEIEQALLSGEIDFAVHSLKDMPSQLPQGLSLAPPPLRADPRDAFVGNVPFFELASGATVGTGSLRRQVQLRALRPDLEYLEIRGNVPTRIEKWRRGDYTGGVVLACAGLRRLGSECGASEREIHPLSTDECVPSPCQGILGLQYRSQDHQILELLEALGHPETSRAMQAERSFLAALGGDCNLPAGGFAQVDNGSLVFRASLWTDRLKQVTLEGPIEEAVDLGRRAALELL